MKKILLLILLIIFLSTSYADDFGCEVALCISAAGMPKECRKTMSKFYIETAKPRGRKQSDIIGSCQTQKVDLNGNVVGSDPKSDEYINLVKHKTDKCMADKINAKGKWISGKKVLQHPLKNGKCVIPEEIKLPNHEYVKQKYTTYRPIKYPKLRPIVYQNYCISTNEYQLYIVPEKPEEICIKLWNHEYHMARPPLRKKISGLAMIELHKWLEQEKNMEDLSKEEARAKIEVEVINQ